MKRYFSLKVALAFLAVFLIGGVAGGLVAINFSDLRFSKFLHRANDPAAMTARISQKLAEEYHLDQDQQARIAPLTREMAERLHSLRQQFGNDVLDTLDAYHRKVADQMTPQQREAYATINEERRRRAAAMLLDNSTIQPPQPR